MLLISQIRQDLSSSNTTNTQSTTTQSSITQSSTKKINLDYYEPLIKKNNLVKAHLQAMLDLVDSFRRISSLDTPRGEDLQKEYTKLKEATLDHILSNR